MLARGRSGVDQRYFRGEPGQRLIRDNSRQCTAAVRDRSFSAGRNSTESVAKMARIAAVKESLEKALKDNKKPWTRIFAMAEEKSGVDRLYIFLASVAILALYLVFGIGQQLVCNIIGFVYPAFLSMKALESPKKEDDSKWLTYWVVFAVFTIIEFFSEYIVCWFPVYWLFKCLFYVWLMAPGDYNGSLILYHRVIRPKFIQYQPNLDKLMSSAKDAAVKVAAEALLTEKQD